MSLCIFRFEMAEGIYENSIINLPDDEFSSNVVSVEIRQDIP